MGEVRLFARNSYSEWNAHVATEYNRNIMSHHFIVLWLWKCYWASIFVVLEPCTLCYLSYSTVLCISSISTAWLGCVWGSDNSLCNNNAYSYKSSKVYDSSEFYFLQEIAGVVTSNCDLITRDTSISIVVSGIIQYLLIYLYSQKMHMYTYTRIMLYNIMLYNMQYHVVLCNISVVYVYKTNR